MKNTIAYILIVISVGIIMTVGYLSYENIYLRYSNPKPLITTGAIPLNDADLINYTSSLIKLADSGDVVTSQFIIHVNNNLKVEIVSYSPFDTNKKAALDWLNSNGFDQIKPNDIIFINSAN